MGAARLLAGLVRVRPPAEITAIVNVGDDVELHGLHVSPDLDTITYTIAGAIDPDRGWGLAGETWHAMEALGRYPGARAWFNLGDRDLATHLYRTDRLRAGATLSEVTAEIVAAWGLGCRLLPVTDDPLHTMVTVADEGEIGFQEYFVRRQPRRRGHLGAVRRCRRGCSRTGRARRDRRREHRGDRAVEPDRVDRPGARRARCARRGGGPSRVGGRRLPHRRRRRAQGPGRPPAPRARARVVRRGHRPALRAASLPPS